MIAYLSRTGNVKDIVSRLDLPSIEINKDSVIKSPYFLFTYTDGLGSTPETVELFLINKINQNNLFGVIASGNTNFGNYFCLTADRISNRFNVPIISKIDLRGTETDVRAIRDEHKRLIEVME
jgi:protein involved in ribonucleotide reduction